MCDPPRLPLTLLLDTTGHFWLCHKTILKCCACDPSNKYYIRIFVKEHTSVNVNSERKCCGIDQMFLKDVGNVPTRSWSILSKLGKIRQELTASGKSACGRTMEWRTLVLKLSEIGLSWTWKHSEARGFGGMLPGKFWSLGPLNGWKCIRNFAKLMFSVSKSMTLPWLSKI